MLVQRNASLQARDGFFDVLYGTPRTQLAQMILREGQESGPYGTDHPHADQIVVVMEGYAKLEMAGTAQTPEMTEHLEPGDVAMIPAGVNHRLTGLSDPPCRIVTMYGPPAYPQESGLIDDAA